LARPAGLLFLLVSVAHPAARGAEPRAGERPPNLVLVVADDLGLTLGCYGDRVAHTPSLDRLAAEGVRFTQAFCTTASCSPSRSVLLTGLHNHANGMYGLEHAEHHFRSLESVPTLPRLLHQAGYHTLRIGKFHVGPEPTYHFDEVLRPGQGGDRNGATMADQVDAFLDRHGDQPFFLLFASTDPHRSGSVGTNSPNRPNRFGNGPDYRGITERTYQATVVAVPRFLPDTAACREELAEYYQSVARFDQGVGRLVDVLRKHGAYDRTVLVMLSDNGIPWPGAKTTLYDPGMHLPLIVRTPDPALRGRVNHALVSWVDVTPTLLDFAGALTRTNHFQGRSFRGVLGQERPAGWDHVFGSHTFHEVTMYYPMRAVRTPTHKLILNLAHPLAFPFASDLHDSATWQDTLDRHAERYGERSVEAYINRPRWELYDLVSDPGEVRNLADEPSSAALRQSLEAELREFQRRTGDPWIVKYRHE
jgi:N-sulfoglucosamine sulfohydrolase